METMSIDIGLRVLNRLGHGIKVSARHYLQVPAELYDKASATTCAWRRNAEQSQEENPRFLKGLSDWAVLDLNQ